MKTHLTDYKNMKIGFLTNTTPIKIKNKHDMTSYTFGLVRLLIYTLIDQISNKNYTIKDYSNSTFST